MAELSRELRLRLIEACSTGKVQQPLGIYIRVFTQFGSVLGDKFYESFHKNFSNCQKTLDSRHKSICLECFESVSK